MQRNLDSQHQIHHLELLLHVTRNWILSEFCLQNNFPEGHGLVEEKSPACFCPSASHRSELGADAGDHFITKVFQHSACPPPPPPDSCPLSPHAEPRQVEEMRSRWRSSSSGWEQEGVLRGGSSLLAASSLWRICALCRCTQTHPFKSVRGKICRDFFCFLISTSLQAREMQ